MVNLILALLLLSLPIHSADTKSSPTPLAIESSVEGPQPTYPGQRLKLIYRIYFKGGISLTEERLPLLEARGFLKIGSVQIVEKEDRGMSVQEITQEVETIAPGTYSFPGASLMGHTTLGKQTDKQPIKAKSEALSIVVFPFPENGASQAFNGAIGKFQISSQLASSPAMLVGDNAILNIEISGTGDLNKVDIPSIYCQPGFSGFFDVPQLPPTGTIDKEKKSFQIELRPLSTLVNAIPSITFAYFDPTTSKYQTVSTKAIPITVHDIHTYMPVAITPPQPISRQPPSHTVDWEKTTTAIPIQNNYQITEKDLRGRKWSAQSAIYLTLITALMLLLQMAIKKFLVDNKPFYFQRDEVRLLKKAKALFRKEKAGTEEFYRLMEQSLLLGIQKARNLPHMPQSPDEIPQHPSLQEVRDLLLEIEEVRFMRKQTSAPELINKTESVLRALAQ
jgi:hypothetical protein